MDGSVIFVCAAVQLQLHHIDEIVHKICFFVFFSKDFAFLPCIDCDNCEQL